MNDFMTSVFPHAYAKIYNGMLQHNGATFVSKYVANLKDGATPDKFIEGHATQRPSDQVYDALKQVYEIWQAGYLHLLSHLKNDSGSFTMRNMRAVVLQIDENERWKKMYDVEGTQFDLLLAVPLLSRIVSVSTSKIGKGVKNAPKPFDVLNINMYGFYGGFNKLHGTSHRSISAVKQADVEKTETFDSVKFAFRTIGDAKMLAGCSNMGLFALHMLNERLILGLNFLCICKISHAESSSATMYAPAGSAEFLLSDESDSVRAIMSPEALKLSAKLAGTPEKLGMCSGSIRDEKLEKFKDLENIEGYFVFLCSWSMGSNMPVIMCAMPLGENLPYRRLYVEALMNTRRKLGPDDLNYLAGVDTAKIVQESEHLAADRSGRWVYYKDPKWDGDALSFLAARDFKKPKLSEVFKSGLSRAALNECYSMTDAYFRCNAFVKNLYCSDDPKADLALLYPKI